MNLLVRHPVSLAKVSVAAAVVAAPGLTHAQPGSIINQPSGVPAPTLTRVEQNVADVDPLGVSFRQLSTDLRQPTGFRDVFRIDNANLDGPRYGYSNPSHATMLARVDGAVTAVFPQSVYMPTRKGSVAMIPPGTIFYIGGLPSDSFSSFDEPPPSETRVDSRVDLRAVGVFADTMSMQHGAIVTQQGPAPQPTSKVQPLASPPLHQGNGQEATPSPGIMTDESIRRSEVRRLLKQAAAMDGRGARTEERKTDTIKPAPLPTLTADAAVSTKNKTAPDEPERR